MEKNAKRTGKEERDTGHSELSESLRTRTGSSRGEGSTGRAASGLDEKSSTRGRRDKSSGLSSKDGLTGSDLDGQVTG